MTASTRAATNSAKTASSSTLAYPSTTTSYAILTRSAHLAAAAAATRTTRSSTAVKAAQTASTAAARRPTKPVHKSSPLAAIPSKRLPSKTTIPTPKTTIPPKKAASSIPPSPRAQRYDKRKRIAEDTTEVRVPKRRRSSGRPATSAPIPSSSRITLDMDTQDDYSTASRAICSSSTCVVESTPGTDHLTPVASSQQDDSHPSDPNAVDSQVAQVSIDAGHSIILDPLSSTMDGDESLTSLPSDGDSDSSDDMLMETPDADGVFISHQPSTPAFPLPSLPDITSYSFVTERPPTRLSPLSCSSFTSSHVQDQSSSTEADADGDIDMDSYNEIHEIEYEYVPERRHKPDPDLWRFTCRHRVGYITAVYGRKLIRELVEEEASRVGWRDYRDEEAYDFELDESDEEDVEWQSSQEMAAEPEMIVFSASPSPEPSLHGQGPPTPFPASSTEPSLSWPPPKLGSVRVPDIWGFGEDWRVRGTPVDHARRSVWASPPTQHFPSDLRSSSPQLYASQDGYGRYESFPPTSPPLQTFVPSYVQPQHFSPPPHPPPPCLPQDNYAHSQHQLFDGNAEAASTSFPLPIDPVMLDQFIERLAANKFEMPEDGSGFMSPVGPSGDGNVIYSVGGTAGAVESFTEMLYAAEEAF